jgi:hypothetical protein
MRKNIFILLLLLPFALNVNAQNDNDQKMQVMMKMLSLKNALLAKDSVSLSGLLADDVTYGHSTGIIQTKAQLIRAVMSGEQDYKSIEPSDMNIRIYDNTGVVTLKLKVNVIYGGKTLDLNMNATLTWVKINGDWKLVARQSVKSPE